MWWRDPDGNTVSLCQPPPPQSEPKQIVRAYFRQLIVDRDSSVCDELLASKYLDHDAPDNVPHGVCTDPFVGVAIVRRTSASPSRISWRTVGWWRCGPMVGHSRRDGRATAAGVGHVLHVDKSGQITERWSVYS